MLSPQVQIDVSQISNIVANMLCFVKKIASSTIILKEDDNEPENSRKSLKSVCLCLSSAIHNGAGKMQY